jgi:hypothetical protein
VTNRDRGSQFDDSVPLLRAFDSKESRSKGKDKNEGGE